MIQVNAMGDACPIPVVKTKNAIRDLNGAGTVETLVDNEIAVQNLQKMAKQKGYGVKAEKLGEHQFKVTMTIGEGDAMPEQNEPETCLVKPAGEKNTVVVIGRAQMGDGSEAITCEGSASLEDLKNLEAMGVEILTCGTCLNFYGLTEKLKVGEVTNMYSIVEKMTQADLIVEP